MRTILIVTVILVAIVVAAIPFNTDKIEYSWQVKLKKASSYKELQNFVEKSSNFYNQRFTSFYYGIPRTLGPIETYDNVKSSSKLSYSKTNIQVEGVDEADIVKTDGEYIYLAVGKQVVILRAYPVEDAEVLSKMNFNGTVNGIFTVENRLVVLETLNSFSRNCATSVKVYDISERENPVLERNLTVTGCYLTSRRINEYVYLIVSSWAISEDGEIVSPKVFVAGGVQEVPAAKVYYSTVPDSAYAFTTVISVNVQNDEQEPVFKSFLIGVSTKVYVSLNNIYLTVPQKIWLTDDGTEKTFIHKIEIKNGEIEYKTSASVSGRVLNQFSMDEYDGYFRIATTIGHVARTVEEASARNNLYILDSDLKIVGKLEGLAYGEQIHSARFMGDRCYLVTFRKIDPFFVIDLQNPYSPKVLGYLKITGYSDYLHPYDENHIIGIGKETVAAENGDFSWYQGVKISLFNVENVSEPEEISRYIIGDRGTDSPVLRDHKALLFDKSRNLLVLPVTVAEINRSKYEGEVPPYICGEPVWQGVYVFNISIENGITLRGKVTHINYNEVNGLPEQYQIKRALYIGNILYTISDEKIMMNSLEDLTEISELDL